MSDAKPELRLVESGGNADIRATVELVEAARRFLIDALEMPDIRSVIEMATVAKDAGRRAAKLAEARGMTADVVEAANDAANDAAAVRNEAQAKAGELLRQLADDGRRVDRGRPEKRSQPATISSPVVDPADDEAEPVAAATSLTLGELGVSKSESSRWQQVAAVPKDVRDRYVEETKAARGEVSTAGLLRYAEQTQAAPGPLVWVRQQGGGRHTWRAGDPPHWCIEEPPEGRRRKAEAEAHRRWLDDEHPDRDGDWELWYSTPSQWVCLGFHPSLEAAQAAAQVIASDRDRMAELDGGRDRRRDHVEAIEMASAAMASRRREQAEELRRALDALPSRFAAAVVTDLDDDERKTFNRTAERVGLWFGYLMAELRRGGQDSDDQRVESALTGVFDLRGLCGSRPGGAGVQPDQLIGAADETDRPSLLAAVRELVAWLVDLECELIRAGADDQLDDDQVAGQETDR